MLTLKFRAIMIFSVVSATWLSTWMVAALSEVTLRDGDVRYVALGLFVGASLLSLVGLAGFLGIALIEWGRHDELCKDLIAVGARDRIFVHSDGKASELKELGERPVTAVVIPAPRRRAMPLDTAPLSDELYNRLLKGGNSHDHQS